MVPKPLYSEGFVFLKNVTQWDADIGKDYVPKNADDFKRVMQALTKPQEDRYATAAAGASSSGDALRHQVVLAVLRRAERVAAGLGRQADAQLRNARVQRGRRLRARPVRRRPVPPEHGPDEQRSQRPHRTSPAGKWTIWLDGFATAWSDPWRRARQAPKPFEVHMIPLFPAHDGGKPVHMLNAAHLGATAIKKGTPDRIKELLRVLNYLAAPFGSAGGLAAVVRRGGPRLRAGRQGQSGAHRARQSGRQLLAIQVHRPAPVGAVPARHSRLHHASWWMPRSSCCRSASPTRPSASSRRQRSATARWSTRRFYDGIRDIIARPPSVQRLRPAGQPTGAPAAATRCARSSRTP